MALPSWPGWQQATGILSNQPATLWFASRKKFSPMQETPRHWTKPTAATAKSILPCSRLRTVPAPKQLFLRRCFRSPDPGSLSLLYEVNCFSTDRFRISQAPFSYAPENNLSRPPARRASPVCVCTARPCAVDTHEPRHRRPAAVRWRHLLHSPRTDRISHPHATSRTELHSDGR